MWTVLQALDIWSALAYQRLADATAAVLSDSFADLTMYTPETDDPELVYRLAQGIHKTSISKRYQLCNKFL